MSVPSSLRRHRFGFCCPRLGIIPEDKAADNATTEPRPGELPTVEYGIKLGGLPQVAPGVSIWADGQLMPVIGLFDPGNSGYESGTRSLSRPVSYNAPDAAR